MSTLNFNGVTSNFDFTFTLTKPDIDFGKGVAQKGEVIDFTIPKQDMVKLIGMIQCVEEMEGLNIPSTTMVR